MYGRYKFTEFMAAYINDLRCKILGYSHEKFGREVFGESQSTSYYLCTSARRKHIHIDMLRKIFLIEYNAHLFVRKQEKMKELLNNAIEQGKVLEKTYSGEKDNKKSNKTTLKYIYKTKNTLISSFNKHRICIPSTIFTIKKCVIDTSFVNGKGRTEDARDSIADSIFDESNFHQSLRYVSINYASLTYLEKIRADKYIADRIDEIFKTIIDADCKQYPEDLLYTEYWLYGMYLMHREVQIPIDMQSYINRLYWNDESKTDWNGIFNKLRSNDNIKNIYKYQSTDCVYFKDENRLISKDDFPLFVYKYIPIDYDKYDEDYSYGADIVRAGTPDKHNGMGTIKLIHLFMSIYDYFLSNGENERSAFEHTGQKFVAYGVDCLPFNSPMLELYPLPQDPNMDIRYETTMKFHETIIKFFQNNEFDEKNDADIIQFARNHIQKPLVFMKAIAFDFEIIKDLNNALAIELRSELQSTVKKFKIKNKL